MCIRAHAHQGAQPAVLAQQHVASRVPTARARNPRGQECVEPERSKAYTRQRARPPRASERSVAVCGRLSASGHGTASAAPPRRHHSRVRLRFSYIAIMGAVGAGGVRVGVQCAVADGRADVAQVLRDNATDAAAPPTPPTPLMLRGLNRSSNQQVSYVITVGRDVEELERRWGAGTRDSGRRLRRCRGESNHTFVRHGSPIKIDGDCRPNIPRRLPCFDVSKAVSATRARSSSTFVFEIS